MKVLFIGGTGVISSACSRLAAERGIDLFLLNRGKSTRPVPESMKILTADIRDKESTRQALGTREFDVVVEWIAFTPEHIETDLDLFRGRTDHYVLSALLRSIKRRPRRFRSLNRHFSPIRSGNILVTRSHAKTG